MTKFSPGDVSLFSSRNTSCRVMDLGSERASGYAAYHGCSATPLTAEVEATDGSVGCLMWASMVWWSEK